MDQAEFPTAVYWPPERLHRISGLSVREPSIPMTTAPTLIVLFICAASVASHAQHQNTAKFNADALFQPGMGAMQAARDTCSKVPGPQFGACFVQQMQAAGASPQAVAFMHAIHDNGFMRDFKNSGRVDIAFAFFPFAANENQHCLLVNGTPSVIDVDDYNLLPKNELAKNPAYAALLRRFPNLAIFPGDRSGTGRALPSRRTFQTAASASWFLTFWLTAATPARVPVRSN
jgi:hypothetical protein